MTLFLFVRFLFFYFILFIYFLASPPLCEVSVGKLKLRKVALPGTSCLWTPLDSEGIPLNESAETVVADDDGVITLSPSPRTIWYTLECDREGYPDDPIDPSTSGVSRGVPFVLKASWVLVVALVMLMC